MKDYDEVKNDYGDLFTTAEKSAATTKVFQESKLQTLDQLIAETMREIKIKRKK